MSSPLDNPHAQPPGEYEFQQHEEEIIRDLAGAMRFVGIFFIVIAVLLGVFGALKIPSDANEGGANLVQALLSFLLGTWTYRAAQSFKLVVETEGNDIANLMNALFQLKRIYVFQKWALIITVAFIVLGMIYIFLVLQSFRG